MIAHVGGVPVEEALLPFMSGAGTGLLLLVRWTTSDGFRGLAVSQLVKRHFRRRTRRR
jgi:hypothetical protein